VVLAGGDSTRFDDGDKALADLHGRPLLGHVVDTVAEATTAPPLLAVSGAGEGDRLSAALERSPEPVVDVTDRAGPLAGLFAAVAAADRPWLFVCGCDMPLVSVEGIDALRAAGDPDDDAVVPKKTFLRYRTCFRASRRLVDGSRSLERHSPDFFAPVFFSDRVSKT